MPAKIKQGKYVDGDGVQQDVVFIGAEKAIFDDSGTRLDNKLTNMSKASGLTAEDAEGILGTPDANVNFQALVDAIADKVMNELVTNSALTTQLANYVTKAMMSNVQVNDNNHVPTSGLIYGMNQDIAELSSDMLKHSYPSLASVITALGKTFSNGTTAQLFNALDQGTSITFYSDNSHISDLPAINGILRLVKGPSNDNQRYVLFHAVNGTLWYYKFHSDNTTNNGWNQVISNADLDGHLAFLSSGETALEAGSGNTRYRLQIDTVGNVLIFKSTDGGSTWPTSKVIASM